jgi:ABC-2 type transport system permease protein
MLLHGTGLIYGRYLRQSLRSRFALLFGVLMPLLYLLCFGPLLTDLPLGERGSSWQVPVPGLLLQLGLSGRPSRASRSSSSRRCSCRA